MGERSRVRRGPLLFTALLAALGGATIYALALPALWRMSVAYGLLLTLLAIAQIGTAVTLLARPARQRMLLAAAVALAVLALWALGRIARVLPPPDPWIPVNAVIGFTATICAGLEAIAALGLVAVAALAPRDHPRRHRSRFKRIVPVLALAPLVALELLAIAIGVYASSDGFVGGGFPRGTVAPHDLPAGQMSTVEYCRPDGVPLAMDLYMPPVSARSGKSAPVALYVHGGGLWGDRKTYGFGARQANQAGALFIPLQRRLNARGFVVAAIDYRLPPGTPWPAQIEDAKCAVRFLRSNAANLGIDPGRIGVWGSSFGGYLASLLGLAGPEAGFDRGQYRDQSSAVQAVVDMLALADLNDFNNANASPFARFILQIVFGSSTAVRRSASPITYVTPGAPPFLILYGTEDSMIGPRQSVKLAQGLQVAAVPTSLIDVQGTGHTLDTPDQQPSPETLTATVVDFFTTNLQ